MRQDPDTTRLLTGHPTVTYNERGEVFCHDPVTGQVHTVSNGGFEAGRQRLKKRCSARLAGVSFAGQTSWPAAQGIRIPFKTERRISIARVRNGRGNSTAARRSNG
jgi:hypothetical protein